MTSEEVKKAKAGFIVSLIGGIIILITDIAMYAGFAELGILEVFGMAGDILFGLGILWAILVIVGAALIWTGKTTAGGIVAILFSILSIFSLALGGFVIGMILGIVGGALGIAKK